MYTPSVQRSIPSVAKALVVAVIAISASACATTGTPTTRLAMGADTAAPAGLVSLCEEQPEFCVAGKPSVSTEEDAKSAAGSPRALSDDDAIALARQVNQTINRSIVYRTDQELWGREEAWALPLTQLGLAYGDCEDYALEKRTALVANGVAPDQLRLATVWSEATGLHAVLVLRTGQGDLVLDNTTPWLLPVEETAYQWRTIQADESLLAWREIEMPGEAYSDQIATAGSPAMPIDGGADQPSIASSPISS